jgi:hypothetical protein
MSVSCHASRKIIKLICEYKEENVNPYNTHFSLENDIQGILLIRKCFC